MIEPLTLQKKVPPLREEKLNRVRFTCWSSSSTCAKSVRQVASAVRLRVTLYFASIPTSPMGVVAERGIHMGRGRHARRRAHRA